MSPVLVNKEFQSTFVSNILHSCYNSPILLIEKVTNSKVIILLKNISNEFQKDLETNNNIKLFCSYFRHIQYNDLSNRVFGWSMDDAPKEHKKKTTLLMYFAQYMDEHLIHGGDMLVKKDERQTLPPAIFMKKWFRTNRAIVMYLNNGTLQVMISPD